MSSISAPSWLLAIPPGTRLLAGATIVLSAILSILRANQNRTVPGLGAVFGASGDSTVAFPSLVLVPGYVIWAPWTLATSAFCEASLIEFIFSLATLVMSGKYLERVWGQWPFVQFVLVSVVASNAIAVVVNALEHVVFGDSGMLLFGQSYHGMMGLQAAFLVAFTQIIPEHQVQLFGGLAKLRVKDLPMLYVTFSNVMVLLGYQSPFILIQFGWLVSWFYLRFIKKTEGMDFRGDRSETFAFSSWFPPFIQPYVSKVTKIVFDLAVKAKIIRAWGPSNDLESGAAASAAAAGHVNTRAEAERRRALALKALDQRLATGGGASSNSSSMSGPAGSGSSPTSKAPVRSHSISSNPSRDAKVAGTSASAAGGSSSNNAADVMFDAAQEDGPAGKDKA